MVKVEVELLEIRMAGEGLVSGRIECPPGLRPGPGQYLLAHAVKKNEALPSALFAAEWVGQEDMQLAPPLPDGWNVGTRLTARGPLGQGFHLPAYARQVALVGLDETPHRLLGLAEQALAAGAEVALYAQRAPEGLPLEVEVLPLAGLPEVLAWASYIAIDLPLAGLHGLKKRFGLAPHAVMPVTCQVLVHVPMPCGGIADCGLCAVPATHGWKLACKDGPVFDINELDLDKHGK